MGGEALLPELAEGGERLAEGGERLAEGGEVG